jgi:hypothetical protein
MINLSKYLAWCIEKCESIAVHVILIIVCPLTVFY